jgi:alpha-D-ribose 1-methylphosphonate 5-triphosphate synthase subunit PhnH
MKQEELQQVQPGFDDLARGSQAVFRCALQALSHPGRPVNLPSVARRPAAGHGAAALLLLTLLDNDCTLWLSPTLAGSDAQMWLRFHTGCRCVQDPAKARFLWLAAGDDWPALAALDAGSDEYPEQSATCVMEAQVLSQTDEGSAWTLEGPGIPGHQRLAVRGLPDDFLEQWEANRVTFPRGVDVFLATDTQVLGLPRTTRLSRSDTVEA